MFSLNLNLNRLYSNYLPRGRVVAGSVITAIATQILKNSTVAAAGNTFNIQASKQTEGHSHLEASVTGSITFHTTGYVDLSYRITENLCVGRSILSPAMVPLQLTLTFYNTQGDLIWSLTESHCNPGEHKKILTIDKELLPQIRTMRTTLLFS